MENKWNIIARNFRKSKEKNVSEDTYQDTIEHQLQLLGWYDGIENKLSIQVAFIVFVYLCSFVDNTCLWDE